MANKAKPWWPDESEGPTIRGDFLELFDQEFWGQRWAPEYEDEEE